MEIDKGKRRNRCRRGCTTRTATLNLRPNAIAQLMRNMCVPMSKLRLVFLWSIFAVQCTSLFGQVSSSANLQVKRDFWGFKEGAPESVVALAQTSDGFLWLGTASGLFRFDGTRFELFHSSLGDRLLSNNIYALFAPPSGGLWIGYAFGGFSFLKDGRVTNYGETASATGSIKSFASDKDGIVWAATIHGLWSFDHSRWQQIEPATSVPAGALEEVGFDREGTLWAMSAIMSPAAEQVIYLRRGSRQFHVARSNLFFTRFTVDADGYVVTSPESKQLFDDVSANAADRPAAYPVLRKGAGQIIDRTNSVWIQDPGPVVLRLPASGQRLSDAIAEASPSNSETYELNPSFTSLVDREGNIWFGEQKGLHRFFYSPLTEQTLPKSAEGSTFFLVTPDENGAAWITAATDQLSNIYLVGHTEVKAWKAPGPLAGFAYCARDKTTWFGGVAGLWHLVKGSLIRVDLPKEKADEASFLQTITEDRRGGMWVSFGGHGLYRLADGVWTLYGGRQDFPKTGVVIEFTDTLGRVWFGYTKNRLAVLDGDRVQVFGPSDGLRVGNITAVYGRGPEIWIGGEFGLQEFNRGHFHTVNAIDDQWLRGISGIVETANGDLWLNGLGGIFHVSGSELSEALKNSAYQVKGEHFGRRAGVPGPAAQLRPLNTAVEGTDGRLWFTGSDGVVWLDPTRSENRAPPPPITIQLVSADDKNYQLASALKFPAHTASVQITYAAVSLSDPEAIRCRYRLQESDRDWHEVSTASPVSYRNLAPGSYHFSVNATDTNGVWSDAVATTEFTILPAFYQTRWFIALCLVSALAFLYMLYMLRVRQLARQFEVRMEERVGERTRIAQELHDTLLQGVLSASMQLDVVNDQLTAGSPAKPLVGRVLQLLRQVIDDGRNAIRGLRVAGDAAQDLAEAFSRIPQELGGAQTGVDFRVLVEGTCRRLHSIARDEVYRIGREAVANAFRHSGATRIEVQLEYADHELRILVRDNGSGIDSQVLRQGKEGHWGLSGMRERAERIGAKLKVWSGAAGGTEMELRVPGRIAFESPTSGNASKGLSKANS
jgi:signal transduction histidine kinase/ligand-binding sensor domain-containing protein